MRSQPSCECLRLGRKKSVSLSESSLRSLALAICEQGSEHSRGDVLLRATGIGGGVYQSAESGPWPCSSHLHGSSSRYSSAVRPWHWPRGCPRRLSGTNRSKKACYLPGSRPFSLVSHGHIRGRNSSLGMAPSPTRHRSIPSHCSSLFCERLPLPRRGRTTVRYRANPWRRWRRGSSAILGTPAWS